MAKIGDKELVFSITFMTKDDEEAQFDARIRDAIQPIRLRFKDPDNAERTGKWRTENGVIHMEFQGWSNVLGTVVAEPARLGDLKGDPIWFEMAQYKIGAINLVHFFVLVGGADA